MSAGGLERPISPLDTERLQREIDDYQSNLDAQCEALYQLANQARSKGFDLSDQVEIPRAIDLADRAEKLLLDYLIAPEYGFEDPIPIAPSSIADLTISLIDSISSSLAFLFAYPIS